MGLLQWITERRAETATWRAGCTPTRHATHRPNPAAEGVGFEPTVPYSGTPLFESGTINHSDTLPPHSIASAAARVKAGSFRIGGLCDDIAHVPPAAAGATDMIRLRHMHEPADAHMPPDAERICRAIAM